MATGRRFRKTGTDIGDWIPVGGEGRALVEVKGKVGKQKMRRFQGRSRFRFSKRQDRYWVPHLQNGGDGTVVFQGYEVPELICRVTPNGDVDADAIQAASINSLDYNSPVARLLMFQGSIPVTCWQEGTLADWFSGPQARTIPLIRLFYWWTKVKASGSGFVPPASFTDPSSGQRVWSASPNDAAGGALFDIMQRKDVISWGFRNITPMNPFNVQMAYNGTAVDAYSARSDPQWTVPKQQFIPLPRIPRKGMAFWTGDSLSCYAVPVSYAFGYIGPFSTSNNVVPSIVEDNSTGFSVKAMPMFRALFTKR